MPEPALTLTVIVPTLGRSERLSQMLKSLSECAPKPAQVIVVDGEDSSKTRAVVEGYAVLDPCVEVQCIASAPGATVQRNRGLAAARGDVVIFLDDDVSFDLTLDVFSQLTHGFADESVVGVTGRIIEDEGRQFGRSDSLTRRFLFGRDHVGHFTEFGYPRYVDGATAPTEVEYMYGGFMCARRTIACEVGFDEALAGYALCEDEDFSFRLAKRGRIMLLPSIRIRHDRYGPRNMRLRDRMLVANRTYLFRKNFPQTLTARTKFALFISLLVGHRLINGELDGAQGLLEGIGDVFQGRIPYAATRTRGALTYSPENP